MLPHSASGQASLSITVTTDKQDYGLGQIVMFTVQVQQSGGPVAHAPVYFELRDSQNEVRANGLISTDDTGKYTKQITIGNDFPLGSYTVYVRVTVGSQTQSATAAFQTISEFTSGMALILALAMGASVVEVCRRRNFNRKQRSLSRNIECSHSIAQAANVR